MKRKNKKTYELPSIKVIEIELNHLFQATFSATPTVEELEDENVNIEF